MPEKCEPKTQTPQIVTGIILGGNTLMFFIVSIFIIVYNHGINTYCKSMKPKWKPSKNSKMVGFGSTENENDSDDDFYQCGIRCLGCLLVVAWCLECAVAVMALFFNEYMDKVDEYCSDDSKMKTTASNIQDWFDPWIIVNMIFMCASLVATAVVVCYYLVFR